MALGVAAGPAVFLVVLLYRLLGAVDRRANLSGPPGLALLVVVVVCGLVWLAIVVRRHRRELEADGLLRDEFD